MKVHVQSDVEVFLSSTEVIIGGLVAVCLIIGVCLVLTTKGANSERETNPAEYGHGTCCTGKP